MLLHTFPGAEELTKRTLRQHGYVFERRAGAERCRCSSTARRLAGAMSLSGPNERFTSERVAAMGMLLCADNGMA